ncbi:MAG: TetR family transcriptional regulator [Spirochaetes bacterium]|jgi:AcrR family transcriptional regulator|nr:TetR family transcriptional regulator [Spirochaetota bacterium]
MEHETMLQERIVKYAGPRFFSEGFSRITTEELSRELGISKKTLYREFGTKEEIVRAVVRKQLAEVEHELSEVFDDKSRSFLERLGAQLRVASRIMNTLGTPFLKDLARYTPELWQEIQEFRHRRVFSRMEGVIQRGKNEGMIRDDADPRLLVVIVTTVADNLLVPQKVMELDLVPQEVIRHMGMLVAEGILTADGREQFRGFDESWRA